MQLWHHLSGAILDSKCSHLVTKQWDSGFLSYGKARGCSWGCCARSEAGLLWPERSANRLAPSSLSLITVIDSPGSALGSAVTAGSAALEMRDRLFYLESWVICNFSFSLLLFWGQDSVDIPPWIITAGYSTYSGYTAGLLQAFCPFCFTGSGHNYSTPMINSGSSACEGWVGEELGFVLH